MKKHNSLVALSLAGLLMISGNFWLGAEAWAQATGAQPTEDWRQKQEQKYQERWEELERENQKSTGQRLQDAEKRRREAEKRQREAERGLQELQPQEK